MPRPPKKPKVAFKWVELPDTREVQAICRLCNAMFWSHSRSGLYPSTANHKETCPKLAEWRAEVRRLDLERKS